VLGFQAQYSPINLPGNNGNTRITPQVCKTASYTAASGDVAVINFSATGSPTAPKTDVLYLNAMASENGGQMEPKNSVDAAESLQDGTGHATVSMRLPRGQDVRIRRRARHQQRRHHQPRLLHRRGDDRAHLRSAVPSWRVLFHSSTCRTSCGRRRLRAVWLRGTKHVRRRRTARLALAGAAPGQADARRGGRVRLPRQSRPCCSTCARGCVLRVVSSS
jgi:hypothetical protein